MANTRRKIVVLVDRPDLRAKNITQGSILDAQVSGNRAAPFDPGKRTSYLTRNEWRFATQEEVQKQAASNHKLQPKDDPTVGDGSVSPDGDKLLPTGPTLVDAPPVDPPVPSNPEPEENDESFDPFSEE